MLETERLLTLVNIRFNYEIIIHSIVLQEPGKSRIITIQNEQGIQFNVRAPIFDPNRPFVPIDKVVKLQKRKGDCKSILPQVIRIEFVSNILIMYLFLLQLKRPADLFGSKKFNKKKPYYYIDKVT